MENMPTFCDRKSCAMSLCTVSTEYAEHTKCTGYLSLAGCTTGRCTFNRFDQYCDWTEKGWLNIKGEQFRAPNRVLTGDKPAEEKPKKMTVEELEALKNYDWG